jgi:N-methylhydantoinase B
MEAPGSGGFGPPEKRDPARLRDDLADGYVSNEAARRDYGAKL